MTPITSATVGHHARVHRVQNGRSVGASARVRRRRTLSPDAAQDVATSLPA